MNEAVQEWVIAPLIAVSVIQFIIWAAVSFVTWDPFFISAFAHRLIFVGLSVFVWSALISHESGKGQGDE